MIVHPSYIEMMDKVNEEANENGPIVNSRYSIVMATSKRARQLIAAEYAEDSVEKKPLSIAVEDIMEGRVHVLREESDNYESYEADEDGRI